MLASRTTSRNGKRPQTRSSSLFSLSLFSSLFSFSRSRCLSLFSAHGIFSTLFLTHSNGELTLNTVHPGVASRYRVPYVTQGLYQHFTRLSSNFAVLLQRKGLVGNIRENETQTNREQGRTSKTRHKTERAIKERGEESETEKKSIKKIFFFISGNCNKTKQFLSRSSPVKHGCRDAIEVSSCQKLHSFLTRSNVRRKIANMKLFLTFGSISISIKYTNISFPLKFQKIHTFMRQFFPRSIPHQSPLINDSEKSFLEPRLGRIFLSRSQAPSTN